MKNRALTSSSFRPKLKTANRDGLTANTSRPIFIVGVPVAQLPKVAVENSIPWILTF